MKVFKATPPIQAWHQRVFDMAEALPTILRPSRFYERGFSMEERVEFMHQLSDARVALRQEIATTYPELAQYPYTVSNDQITCRGLGEPESVDAVDPVGERVTG